MIRLRTQLVMRAPIERCFDLVRSVDLHAASARAIRGYALAGRTSGLAEPGDWTTWSARFFGLRFKLSTRIADFDRPHRFCDVLCAGLFSRFEHDYHFQSLGPDETVVTDDFCFQSPFGPVGAAFDAIVLRPQMQQVAMMRALYIQRVAESDESQEWRRYLHDGSTS